MWCLLWSLIFSRENAYKEACENTSVVLWTTIEKGNNGLLQRRDSSFPQRSGKSMSWDLFSTRIYSTPTYVSTLGRCLWYDILYIHIKCGFIVQTCCNFDVRLMGRWSQVLLLATWWADWPSGDFIVGPLRRYVLRSLMITDNNIN